MILTALVILNAPAPEPLQLEPYPQLIAERFTTRHGLPPGPLETISVGGRTVLAAGPRGAARFENGRWSPAQGGPLVQLPDGVRPGDLPAGARIMSWAPTRTGGLWVATTAGAFKRENGRWSPLDLPRAYKYRQPAPHIDTVIRAIQRDAAGTVWLVTDQGLYATDGADWWHRLAREDGMPYEDLLCVAFAPNGDIWGGTAQGAWRLRRGQWRYFWGRRWLPGNRVNAVAVAEDGSAWLATDGGVARISERSMRLEEKAAHYERITAARHDRQGFVTGCRLKVPGEPEAGFVPHASDNDGLWTALYVAGEAFRYAATRSPEARDRGRKSMQALLDLVRKSGVPGFPARSYIRKGEVVDGYDPEETVRVEGEADKIWYQSPVDASLIMKGDTSSDELDGHYFAWFIYHDLAADADEKRQIRDVVRSVTSNILDHDYTLVGHTGRKTRWGVFGPQFLNDDPRWETERGLNSLSLLCYLKVAHHLCGDKRFADAYVDLIDNHHYLLNTLHYRLGTPWHQINHSDDELAYCVYYPLLMLEKDPARRAILLQSLANTWKGIRPERSPFYNFLYGAMTGDPCDAEEAVETLQGWPWELVNWEVRNSHRHDVRFRQAPGSPRRQLDRVLPIEERRVMKWNGNPWLADYGGDGGSEEDGTAFLLPYWLGRHHGLIRE